MLSATVCNGSDVGARGCFPLSTLWRAPNLFRRQMIADLRTSCTVDQVRHLFPPFNQFPLFLDKLNGTRQLAVLPMPDGALQPWYAAAFLMSTSVSRSVLLIWIFAVHRHRIFQYNNRSFEHTSTGKLHHSKPLIYTLFICWVVDSVYQLLMRSKYDSFVHDGVKKSSLSFYLFQVFLSPTSLTY